jgi:hypothetical protein
VVKLVKNGPQYKLTVPLDIIKDKGWTAGTEFRFVEDKDGNITLKPILPKDSSKTEGADNA